MNNYREYVYGWLADGSKEFLHTFLNTKGAVDYIEKHGKIFPQRYQKYSLWRPIKGNHYWKQDGNHVEEIES